MHLSSLHIYPLKSARGISLDTVELDDFGPVLDRRWMLIDSDRALVTRRELHRMALIDVALSNGGIRVSAPGAGVLEAGQGTSGDPLVEVRVWDDRCLARDLGDSAARWFSGFLERQVRLVFMPDETFRQIDIDYVPGIRRVSFADGFPLLLIGEGSLEELNRRLSEPVPMNRFRPNLVLAGSEPFAEDTWESVRIGAVGFDVLKPCSRCVATTVDHETAQSGKEPLRTLATFRRRGQGVYFGQNLLHQGPGLIRVGDPAVPQVRKASY